MLSSYYIHISVALITIISECNGKSVYFMLLHLDAWKSGGEDNPGLSHDAFRSSCALLFRTHSRKALTYKQSTLRLSHEAL